MQTAELRNVTIKAGANICLDPKTGNTVLNASDFTAAAKYDATSYWWCWGHEGNADSMAYTKDLELVVTEEDEINALKDVGDAAVELLYSLGDRIGDWIELEVSSKHVDLAESLVATGFMKAHPDNKSFLRAMFRASRGIPAIRGKNANKPHASPLPGAVDTAQSIVGKA